MSPSRPYIIPKNPPVVFSTTPGEWLIAPHWPYDRQALAAVEWEMSKRKHCLIRVVPGTKDAEWLAIEGSHRIWIAARRRVPVTLQRVGKDYLIQHDEPSVGIVTARDILSVGPEIRGPEARYRMRLLPPPKPEEPRKEASA